MSNEEIFARIERDVNDIYGVMLSKREITIWMTKGLFNRLLPEQFIGHKDTAMVTLFGCSVKVVILPYGGEQWIVGYEGTVNDRRST